MPEDHAALEHLRKKIEAELSSRDDEHAKEAGLIVRQAAARGMLFSGNTVHSLGAEAVQDLRIRGHLLLKALTDTWASYRPEPSAALFAHQMVLSVLQDAADARDTEVRNSAPMRSLGSFPETVWEGFRAKYDNEVQRVDLRLREWVQLQERPPTEGGATQSTTVNLNGSNNVVVAGVMHSPTSVQLDGASTPRILDALASVRAAIESTRALPEQETTDTLELVADAEEQLKRPQPNKKKLFASLQGVAGAIQTVGALGDAYNNLKSAMALIGLPLP
ncbi:hypothetical protein [Methylorubrum extorquens]